MTNTCHISDKSKHGSNTEIKFGHLKNLYNFINKNTNPDQRQDRTLTEARFMHNWGKEHRTKPGLVPNLCILGEKERKKKKKKKRDTINMYSGVLKRQ